MKLDDAIEYVSATLDLIEKERLQLARRVAREHGLFPARSRGRAAHQITADEVTLLTMCAIVATTGSARTFVGRLEQLLALQRYTFMDWRLSAPEVEANLRPVNAHDFRTAFSQVLTSPYLAHLGEHTLRIELNLSEPVHVRFLVVPLNDIDPVGWLYFGKKIPVRHPKETRPDIPLSPVDIKILIYQRTLHALSSIIQT